MSAGSGAALDDNVKAEIAAFIQTGSKKVGEKCPWILFNVDKKDKNDRKAKDVIKIMKKGEAHQTYDDLVQTLLSTEAAYALADYALTEDQKGQTTTTTESYLVFINWTLETAPVKKKMVASASVGPLRSAITTACKVTLESHDYEDISPEVMFKNVKKCYKI